MYLYLSLFKKKMINSIIIRGQLGVSLVAEIKKQTCQAQWSSPTRKKLRFCPNWRPPSSSQGYPKIPLIHDIAFMKCGFPHIYGHLQEEYVLETFDKKCGLRNPPPLPLYRQKLNFCNPKIALNGSSQKSHWLHARYHHMVTNNCRSQVFLRIIHVFDLLFLNLPVAIITWCSLVLFLTF